MTQHEFIKTFKMDQGSINRLVRGVYKTSSGWKMFNGDQP